MATKKATKKASSVKKAKNAKELDAMKKQSALVQARTQWNKEVMRMVSEHYKSLSEFAKAYGAKKSFVENRILNCTSGNAKGKPKQRTFAAIAAILPNTNCGKLKKLFCECADEVGVKSADPKKAKAENAKAKPAKNAVAKPAKKQPSPAAKKSAKTQNGRSKAFVSCMLGLKHELSHFYLATEKLAFITKDFASMTRDEFLSVMRMKSECVGFLSYAAKKAVERIEAELDR